MDLAAHAGGASWHVCMSGLQVLPTELISLRAKEAGGNVVVEWTLGSHVNLKEFIVERLVTGGWFEDIDKVSFDPNLVRDYFSFEDHFPARGTSNYYRLKIVDLEPV